MKWGHLGSGFRNYKNPQSVRKHKHAEEPLLRELNNSWKAKGLRPYFTGGFQTETEPPVETYYLMTAQGDALQTAQGDNLLWTT